MAVKLGEAMVRDSLITREQLRLALERQVVFGGRIGSNLVELGIIREPELASFLSKFLRIPLADPLLMTAIDKDTISCISREIAEKYKVVPFKKERNRLHVAMIDPSLLANVDELRFVTGYDILPYCITELRLLFALEKYYGTERDLRYISIFGKEEEQDNNKDKNREHLEKVKNELANAKDKEEIIGILLNEARRVASRVAVFVVRGDKLSGWKSKGLEVENIEAATSTPSLFTDVMNKKSYYRGPLLKLPGNQPLIKALGGTPQDCFMIPIQIRDKIIALLYADNGNTSVMDASVSYINSLVAMSSVSFEIVILRNKILSM